MSTISEQDQSAGAMLYSSPDPEFYPWESLINPDAPGFDPTKNPTGPIWNMEVFNNRIYVTVSDLWCLGLENKRSWEPKLNDWTLIVDRGLVILQMLPWPPAYLKITYM